MDIDTERAILVALNGWIAFAYIVLSVGFMAFYVSLLSLIPFLQRTVGKTALTAALIGTALFFAGCGLHHAHLATEMIPNSIDKFGARSLWIEHFAHHTLISAAQAVGSTLLLFAGLRIRRGVRLNVTPTA